MNKEKMIFDWTGKNSFVTTEEVMKYQDKVMMLHQELHDKKGLGNDFLGWLETDYITEIERINKCAKKLAKLSDVCIVIGIGGSYLGAKAVLSSLQHYFEPAKIIFLGHHISSTYTVELFEYLNNHEITVNVISKSGTTTEPAIAFRLMREYMEERYGKAAASERIVVTTDAERGALKILAEQEGYEAFVIADDIGGRYSVFTPVGLLPLALADIEIESFAEGALAATKDFSNPDLASNIAYQYAVIRNVLYKRGKKVELLAYYEPGLQYLAEWWKQLFGESEGKGGQGIFPASVGFSTDLHSLGQYIQDGERFFIETVIDVAKPRKDITMAETKSDLDGLNYLAGKKMSFVNEKAMQGTIMAHVSGGVPNLVLRLPELNAYYMGYLMYFFMKACAMSGYLLGVNPFDQPGVEEYKKNMFKLLKNV